MAFRLKVHAGRAQDMLTGGAFVLLLGAMLLLLYIWSASIPVSKYAADSFDHYHLDDAYGDLNLDFGEEDVRLSPDCSLEPVGVDNTLQRIPATQLSASSAVSGGEPARGRLNYKPVSGGEGAWVPEKQDREQWLQVDLGKELVVGGVVTQGSGEEVSPSFVRSFHLSYSMTGEYWITYSNSTSPQKLFSGNTDELSPVQTKLDSPVRARYVRVCPQEWERQIALRLEVLYCTNET
ncbi:lactadherin-like [Branchiostoma floridae x Branchiostoma japonicum]